MKIVIIGAGISGCAAYLELRKHLPKPSSSSEADHEITIYEAYDTDKDTTPQDREDGPTHSSTLAVGGALGVGQNGLNVLRRLDEDLLRDIVRGGYVVDHSNLKKKNGGLLIRMDDAKLLKSAENELLMHNLGISRHSFWRSLRVRIPDQAIINKRVSEVIASVDGRNIVKFVDDSPPVEADLVIGADGVKSSVKRALFPESKDDPYAPRYEGLVGIGGFIPTAEVRDHVEKGSMNFVFAGNGFFGYFFADSDSSASNRDSLYHVSEPGMSLSWWSTYAIEECPDPKTLDMEDVANELRKRHANWKDPVIQKIIQSARVENMYPTWTSPPLPTWERDGVVLVGDAAHALPPTSGQGSSQALEDVEAFVLFLAHHLQKAEQHQLATEVMTQKQTIKIAAKQYMDIRKPRVTEILEAAQKIQNSKRDKGVIAEFMMYSMMSIIGFFPTLMSKQVVKVNTYNVAKHVEQILAANK